MSMKYNNYTEIKLYRYQVEKESVRRLKVFPLNNAQISIIIDRDDFKEGYTCVWGIICEYI